MYKDFSFKNTLVLFSIVVGCVPLLLTGAVFVRVFSDTLEMETQQRNLVAAKSFSGEINRLLVDYRSLLEYVADRMNAEEPDLQGVGGKLRLQDLMRRYQLFTSLTILNCQAIVQTAFPWDPAALGMDFSGQPFIRLAMANAYPVWSDVYLSNLTGSPTISLAVPFRHGFVVGDMNLDILQETAQKMRTGIGSYAVIVDQSGVLITHPRRELVEQRVNVRNLAFVQAGLRGEEGTYNYEFMGEEKIGSVAVISETGWLGVIVQPRREAFSPVVRLKSLLWTATITIAVLVMILSAWMHQKTIAPLLHLNAVAKRISEGCYTIEPVPKSFVEVDALAQAFQSMACAISEREQSLQESRKEAERTGRRLCLLYDSVSDLIYAHDLDGRILSANKAFTDLLGYEPGAVVGELITFAMKPEHHERFQSEYLARFQTQPSQQGTLVCYDQAGNKRYVEYASTLVTDEEGNSYVTGIGRNVTERILTEQVLRQQGAQMRAILKAMPTPLAAYDTKGRLQFTNAAFQQVFGWSMEELQGNPIPFVPESEKAVTRAKIKELYATAKSGILETKRLTRDGRTIDVLISAALIQDGDGHAEGMVACFLDLTEKKRLEAELLQSQKMEAIGTLAGGIAHDFNNLLMVIEGNVSLMMLDLAPDHPMMQRLKDISKNVAQGASLTRQLLGFAKGGKYEVQPIDINRLIRDHHAVFQRTNKGYSLIEELAADLPAVVADRGQMEQVLLNLYINAVQAMPEGGSIRIRTEAVDVDPGKATCFHVNPGRYVCMHVTDTGIGMDEHVRKRIFDPFFTTKEKGRGTGLGLASVYGIIQHHGGFIEVDSWPMKGTTFRVFLPTTDERPVDDSSKESECSDPVVASQGPRTILLVDDEPMVREVGAELLQHLGYEVMQAEDGQAAIDLYGREGGRIDLVILDMVMPGMSGDVVFDRLKAMNPSVAVILSSGYSVDGQAQAILDKGCKGFLQKPFSVKQLTQVLEDVFAGR